MAKSSTNNKLGVHRPGLFKLPPKKHSTGRHRSKSAIAKEQKGKTCLNRNSHQPKLKQLKKLARRNRKAQIRENKKSKLSEQKLREGLAPISINVVSFDEKVSSRKVVEIFNVADAESIVHRNEQRSIFHLAIPRFKQRYAFFCPETTNSILDTLDFLRVSDVLLILWPSEAKKLKAAQIRVLSALFAQGTPKTLNIVSSLPASGKQRDSMRKALCKVMAPWIKDTSRIFEFGENNNNVLQVLRQISTMKKHRSNIQKMRPYLIADNFRAINDENNADSTTMLVVSGYLRGAPLNVNALVHIPGAGDFQLSQVLLESDPYPLKKKKESMEEAKVIKADASKQTKLDSEIVPDPMDADQPSVTEDDDSTKFKIPKVKVPKGTSEYQASWLIDDDVNGGEEEENDESDDENDDSEGSNSDQMEENLLEMKEEEEQESLADGADDNVDMHSEVASSTMNTFDLEEAEQQQTGDGQLDLFRKERENRQWPDEVETPVGMNARERFQRYRGLKSFRTSPWDPKENLPHDYARIYKIVNFKRTRKLAFEEAKSAFQSTSSGEEEQHFCSPGTFLTLHIKDFPRHLFESLSSSHSPLSVFGLLKHEHRISTLNMVLQKQESCSLPVKNKEELLFQVGCRRFTANPVFSQHTNGQKFKMERFMPSSGAFCATVFAPITFPPSNVLAFRQSGPQKIQLVASGIVLDTNPDRIILKRARLSGHPFKVNKRSAVVRYMFFNREDIEWFKPVELYTHSGRHGRIKQALGTHGLMKCVFDQPLSVQDSVLLNLYKRVFPKWTYNAKLGLGKQFCIAEDDEERNAENEGKEEDKKIAAEKGMPKKVRVALQPEEFMEE